MHAVNNCMQKLREPIQALFFINSHLNTQQLHERNLGPLDLSMWSIYARSHFELSQEATVCLSSFPGKEKLCGLIIIFIYISYIFIYFSALARSLSCYWEIAHLSHSRSFVFINDVTKMVTGLKLQSPKKKRKENKTSENRRGGK